MNKVQQKIFDDVVKPALDNVAGNIIGIVRAFDNLSQTGTVTVSSPLGREERAMHDVPMMNISGTKQANPFPGDTVMITFLGSNHQHPVILGKVDSKHFLFTRNEHESHFRAGSNVTDLYNSRDGEEWNDPRQV